MRWLPDGLAGRTILVLLGSVALVHAVSVVVYESGVRSHALSYRAQDVAEQIAAARQVMAHVPLTARTEVVAALSTANLQFAWFTGVSAPNQAFDTAASLDMRSRLAALGVASSAISAGSAPPATRADDDAIGVLPLPDGSGLQFTASLAVEVDQHAHMAVLSTTMMVGGILLVSILLVRSIAAPLRRLARAADMIGHTVDPTPVAVGGPTEVRLVAKAFNAMQVRLRRLIDDRTYALAAVSHDLRTPITRLRLRAGFIQDRETQLRFDADLDEMNAMIESTLTYLKGGGEAEARRTTDLASLIATIVDDLADTGHQITWDGPTHAVAILRPVAFKRALANLFGNAVTHGKSAHAVLAAEGAQWRLSISDNGPGIPEADLDRVREPFQRLENSRNRNTGGVGLGLTIAAQAIAAEGGSLLLQNRHAGGLEVQVLLPRLAPVQDQASPGGSSNA